MKLGVRVVAGQRAGEEVTFDLGLAPSPGPAEFLVGRHPSCELWLPDTSVSSRHAKLRYTGERWEVYDLGSTNGTFLGLRGIRLAAETPVLLGEGGRVLIGAVELEYWVDRPAAQPMHSVRVAPPPIDAAAVKTMNLHTMRTFIKLPPPGPGEDAAAPSAPFNPQAFATPHTLINQSSQAFAAPQTLFNPPPQPFAAPQTLFNPPPQPFAAPQTLFNPPPAAFAAPETLFNSPPPPVSALETLANPPPQSAATPVLVVAPTSIQTFIEQGLAAVEACMQALGEIRASLPEQNPALRELVRDASFRLADLRELLKSGVGDGS